MPKGTNKKEEEEEEEGSISVDHWEGEVTGEGQEEALWGDQIAPETEPRESPEAALDWEIRALSQGHGISSMP